MSNKPLAKTYANTYLYNAGNFENKLFNYLMTAEHIDKNHESFKDIVYEVKKRQVSNSLTKVLESKNIILLMPAAPMSKAFKVMTAKDVKGDHTEKVFIDCDVIKKIDGSYKCTNIDILIAYLVSAMNQFIYYRDPKRLIMRDEINSAGARCFSGLFTHIIDYLYKISTNPSTRDKCIYLSSIYYVSNILRKDITDSVKHMCRKISGISEREEEILWLQLNQEEAFDNINYFVLELGKILRLPKLTLDAFLEKWIYIYGVGTQFALELYPAFATMITNVYVGCYLNNQKTIEKVVGRDMISFSTTILRVGAESV